MLNSSLKTVGVTNVNVVAILNDTTGTLVAGSHDFPNTAVGKLVKTYHALVAEQVATENKTLHGQDFCKKMCTGWSVTLQNSRSFMFTI